MLLLLDDDGLDTFSNDNGHSNNNNNNNSNSTINQLSLLDQPRSSREAALDVDPVYVSLQVALKSEKLKTVEYPAVVDVIAAMPINDDGVGIKIEEPQHQQQLPQKKSQRSRRKSKVSSAKVEEATVVPPAPVQATATTTTRSGRRVARRVKSSKASDSSGSDDKPAGRGKQSKRKRGPSAHQMQQHEADEEEEEDEDQQHQGDEESPVSKRERNKLSASKYRKRRKIYLESLEGKVDDLNSTVKKQNGRISALDTENQVLRKKLSMLKELIKGVNMPTMSQLKGLVGLGDGTTSGSDSDCSSEASLDMAFPHHSSDEEYSDRSESSPGLNGVGTGMMMFGLFALLACSPSLPTDVLSNFQGDSLHNAGRTLSTCDDSASASTPLFYFLSLGKNRVDDEPLSQVDPWDAQPAKAGVWEYAAPAVGASASDGSNSSNSTASSPKRPWAGLSKLASKLLGDGTKA